MLIGTDIDGTLLPSPLHWGGTSRTGMMIYRLWERTGVMEKRMREARLDPLACQILREAHARGAGVVAITARSDKVRQGTYDCFTRNDVGFITPYTRAPQQMDVAQHKTYWIQRLKVDVYLEDDCELAVREQKILGVGGPLIVHMTDWRLMPELLRRVWEGAR